MKCFLVCFLVSLACSAGVPAKTEEDQSSSSWSHEVQGGTDLAQLDRDISDMYKNPDPLKRQKLIDNMHLFLITLRRFNTMTKKGCSETIEQASRLVHSGGPRFLKTFAFYSDREQVLRYQLNFTDYQFQEYQYNRLDTETEWSELKDQIAHLDRDREKENERREKLV